MAPRSFAKQSEIFAVSGGAGNGNEQFRLAKTLWKNEHVIHFVARLAQW
jgi:hypothetical protein